MKLVAYKQLFLSLWLQLGLQSWFPCLLNRLQMKFLLCFLARDTCYFSGLSSKCRALSFWSRSLIKSTTVLCIPIPIYPKGSWPHWISERSQSKYYCIFLNTVCPQIKPDLVFGRQNVEKELFPGSWPIVWHRENPSGKTEYMKCYIPGDSPGEAAGSSNFIDS